MKFDHIGIFVKDLEQGCKHMESIFPISSMSKIYEDSNLKVQIQFLYDQDGICYELVAPFGEGNPVESVLSKNINILNHVAYNSINFEKSIEHLRSIGCMPLGPPKQALAFNNARVIFFLTPLRMILEIIEA